MPLIGAEAAAASLAAFLSSAILYAYLADRLGFAIAPLPLLSMAAATAAALWLWLRRAAASDWPASAASSAIAVGTFACLMIRARPDFLPTGTGSDLAHHLALLAFIERHWHLPHDPVLGAYLGEMIDYTPGFHLLAVLAGSWFRRDALHAVHTLIALTAALKCVFVFLIARRLLPEGVPRLSFAAVAVLLLWLPYTFFAGSFMAQSFLSQVVSELFAVAMWWALVVWIAQPATGAMALFALFGVAAFLTWPIWVGPLAATLASIVLLRRQLAPRQRARDVVVALLPIAGVAVMYVSTRLVYGLGMVNAVGFAIWPGPHTLGWPFMLLAAAGLGWSATDRRARSAAVLFGFIAVQGAALIVFGRSSGASAPYLSLKMAYLAIYPMAVAASALLALAWREALRPAVAARYGWAVIILATLAAGRSLLQAAPVKPVVTQPVFLAGDWARTHLPPACIDYLVADGYTGYWLHLAVLGNPRAAGRALDNDTFEPAKATVRWILPGGLPYAIAGDFDALPRDIRTNVDVLARFGPAAVLQRRGPSACPP